LSKIASSEIMKEAGYEYIDLGVLFGESEYKEDSWGVNWDEQTRTQNAAEKLGIDYGNLFSKISTYSYEAFSSALSAVEQMS